MVATITGVASALGSPAAASRQDSITVRPTTTATTFSKTRFTSTISMRPFCNTLGIDHQRFTVKFQGLDSRLTGVEGARVVKEVLA